MGGMGSEDLSYTREFMVCKDPFNLFLELAENPSAKRQNQEPVGPPHTSLRLM